MRPRRRLLAWLTALTLAAPPLTALTLSAAPAAAFAAHATTTHFEFTESRAEVNPCSGAPGTLTIALSGVAHHGPERRRCTLDRHYDRHGHLRSR
jgi:hypothetical protein